MRSSRKFLCLFLMALAVFALSGCGGGHDGEFVSSTDTQSQDVTPTPTPAPASPDVTPTPTPSPTTSLDVTPTPATTPTPTTSPDVTPAPAPTPSPAQDSGDKSAAPSESTLNVSDSATAAKVVSALDGVPAGTEVSELPEGSVGTERSVEALSAQDLAAIPASEEVALVLPIMRVDKPAVYVWGLDLSSLTVGDYLAMYMMPEADTAASIFAAAEESDLCVFLDDSGSKVTRVPANKKVNAAAYMTPGRTYAPVVTTSKTQPEQTPAETPETPASQDVTPTPAPVSPDVEPVVEPTSGDVPPERPESGDVPSDRPDRPESGDTPAPTPSTDSEDVTPSTDSEDVTPSTESVDVNVTEYTATTAGEHAIALTSSTTATYNNVKVTKTGDAAGSSDGTSGYDWTGSNAAVFASGGGTLNITGSSTTITSNARGGNAVFAYGGNLNGSNSGNGTTINISDATITTSSNNSGGIMVTGGGVIEASNLTITTSGGSSAAIRSDRGGGTITVTGGTYTTNGVGSPAIYSTAAITGNDVTLQSNVAQVVVIEGGNSVTLDEATLIANNTTRNGQDKYHQAVLIYQSMSGDASDGSSSFSMEVGSLTNSVGDVFHVTNTTTTITLKGVSITNNDSDGYFLRASEDSWGTSGRNGGNVTLNADGQTITGDMLVDSSSSLALNMTNSSVFNGAINSSAQAGSVSVTIEAGSTWTLMGNSYVTSLTNNGTINQGSYTLYVNGQAYSN